MSEARKTRILVADDDQSIRQLVCTILKREHYTADCVGDGVEAIEHLEKHDYAVVLLDLMMPRLDGVGVIEYLKTHPPAHKPIVLVISALSNPCLRKRDGDSKRSTSARKPPLIQPAIGTLSPRLRR